MSTMEALRRQLETANAETQRLKEENQSLLRVVEEQAKQLQEAGLEAQHHTWVEREARLARQLGITRIPSTGIDALSRVDSGKR